MVATDFTSFISTRCTFTPKGAVRSPKKISRELDSENFCTK